MQRFDQVDGVAVPMAIANIDTDQLFPARFLRKARELGLGLYLFHDLRFDEHGKARDRFILNQPQWQGASVLVTLWNFGCGSSREYAVYSLLDFGIRAVIAPSFGGILYNNSLKNGLLPVVLGEEEVRSLLSLVDANPGAHLVVDLEKQQVRASNGDVHQFHIDSFSKHCLLHGLDDFDFAVSELEKINAFEARHAEDMPWV
jgi:3-isopropylmalate/(R)-2-methylmalate dehydratase small subunit